MNHYLQGLKKLLIELLITNSQTLTKEYIKDCLKAIRDKDQEQIKTKIYEIEETLTGRENG